MIDKPAAEEISVWNEGHTEIVTVHITPPKISESNAAYVDWLYAADYLLPCRGTTRDDIDAENTHRRVSFRPVQQSDALRRLVVLALEMKLYQSLYFGLER